MLTKGLIINSNLYIPENELLWKFSKASGPGGQNVNKTDSRVELIFDIHSSSALSTTHKNILIANLSSNLIGSSIRIVVAERRSQLMNRQTALKQLKTLILACLQKPIKVRKTTHPTKGSQKKRLESKRQKGSLKRNRNQKYYLDD